MDVSETIKEHPILIVSLVLVVALIAYLSRGSGGSSVAYSQQGEIAPQVDPNAAAISEAAISAGQQNLSTIASLIGLQNTNATQLAGTTVQTNAAENVSLAQTSANRDVSLASIAANLKASMFQTEADRDESLASTAAGVTTAENATSAQLQAAQYNQAVQLASIDAQRYIATQNANVEMQQSQNAKDVARASDNTSIVNGLVHLGEAALSIFGL